VTKKKPKHIEEVAENVLIIRHTGARQYKFEVTHGVIDKKVSIFDIKAIVNNEPYDLLRAINAMGIRRFKAKISKDLKSSLKMAVDSSFDPRAFAKSISPCRN